MRALVTGRTPVIATVGLRGGGFVAEVKRFKGFVRLTPIRLKL
jgi:hypothetical protein